MGKPAGPMEKELDAFFENLPETSMRNLLLSLINGRSNKISGLFALTIVALIALGCTCGKNFDLGNLGKENTNSTRTASNTSRDDDDDTPPTKTKPSSSKADASKGEMP